jgi:predicted enzyme related to lactoylglutathione lyase
MLLVNIDVEDLKKAVDFYTSAFELREGRRLGKFAVELIGAEAPIYLLEKQAGTTPFPGASEGRRYERHWTPVHLDIEVDDLDTALGRAEAAGAKRDAEISSHAWGRMAMLSDPFGHGFCLLEFSERGYDEIAT